MDTKQKLIPHDLPRVVLFGGSLIAYVVSLFAPASLSSGAAQPEVQAPVWSLSVKSFAAKGAEMGDALRALRSQDVSEILIGFERFPHREGENRKSISLDLTSTTVGEVVRRLCQADSRYEFELVQGRMIEVRPKGANRNPENPLNVTVHEYNVSGKILPAGAIAAIAQDAPELREFLRRKEEEWIKKTGRYPGYPGSIVSGNMTPPLFSMHLQNVTVRQILNAIALESLKMFHEGKAFGPTGWEYDFIEDPNAGTTLGGYPRWSAF